MHWALSEDLLFTVQSRAFCFGHVATLRLAKAQVRPMPYAGACWLHTVSRSLTLILKFLILFCMFGCIMYYFQVFSDLSFDLYSSLPHKILSGRIIILDFEVA